MSLPTILTFDAPRVTREYNVERCAATQVGSRACANCGKFQKPLTRRCGSCHKYFYCCTGCQRLHWEREHKAQCCMSLRMQFEKSLEESESEDDSDGDAPPVVFMEDVERKNKKHSKANESSFRGSHLPFIEVKRPQRLHQRAPATKTSATRQYQRNPFRTQKQSFLLPSQRKQKVYLPELALSKNMIWQRPPKPILQHAKTAQRLHNAMLGGNAQREVKRNHTETIVAKIFRGEKATKHPEVPYGAAVSANPPRAILNWKWG